MINLKIIKDAGFAGRATPPDAGAPISHGKGKGGGIGGGKKGGIDPNSALLENLVSWYNLDETGTITTWADETANANDLANVSVASTATAKYGTAADFTAVTGSYAWIDGTGTGFATGTSDFSVCGWLYSTATVGTSTWAPIFFRGAAADGGASSRDFILGRFSSTATNFYATVYHGGTSTSANSTVSTANGAWFFCAATFDYSTKTVSISVNNETFVTAVASAGPNSNNRVHLGRGHTSGTGSNWYVKGYEDNVAFWNGRVLTQDEVNWLYNEGNGRQYSELT